MKLPKQGELIRVFSKAYSKGKLRYFKKENPKSKTGWPVIVYAEGRTKKIDSGAEEYWESWKIIKKKK